jgi:hypothetical protein
MPPYPVLCTSPGCGAAAVYKVAAQWSDGVTSEMKTYALCCDACLKKCFEVARLKHTECPLEIGETLGEPGIYERGNSLKRRAELEST